MTSDVLVSVAARGGEPTGVSARLVVLPPSGAGPQYARPLVAPRLDVWGARYPGRENRRARGFASSIEAIADEVADAVADVHAARPLPLVLLGSSMGVGVAVEAARRLARTSPGAVHGLVLAGRAAPPTDPDARARGRRADEALLTLLTDDQALRDWVEDLGGTPRMLLDDADFMAMLAPVLRADLRISLAHDALAGCPVDVPVVLACGDDDPVVDAAAMSPWRAVTTGPTRALPLRGRHHAVVEDVAPVLAAVDDLTRTAPGAAS